MKASETKLQPIIEGTKQYVVPLFQRPYSWDVKEWETLWTDLVELCEDEQPRSHFFGSIVTTPAQSVPEGVTKYLLIDGQQRITTIFILLALLRDKARGLPGTLTNQIEDLLLMNRYQEGTDVFKLLPTQGDRESFIRIMRGEPDSQEDQITKAYKFFEKRLRSKLEFSLETLRKVIVSNLMLVSIVLDRDDNPHLIFESLNYKGRPLSQADLIRNYFFMRVQVHEQERLYQTYWKPMQERLGGDLTECIRHFLMKDGGVIKQSDVYFALKESVDDKSQEQILAYLEEIAKFAGYYARLLHPGQEPSSRVRERLERLNRIEVTTAYPFLLKVYHDYATQQISEDEFVDVLNLLENFMIRRFVCSVPTYGLNKMFPSLYAQAKQNVSLVDGVKEALRTKNYPRDTDFRERLVSSKLYGSGERLLKTRLILERLEESFEHKESVPFQDLTIEHVMPRTLTDWWKTHLGENWETVHELLLDTLGNLTLSGYNPNLSNSNFPAKQEILSASHLELNKYFSTSPEWNEKSIRQRADVLAERALKVWQFFGPVQDGSGDPNRSVTGTTPTTVIILGQRFPVSTWREVAQQTLETLAELEEDRFDQIVSKFPHFVGRDSNKFRRSRQLRNGAFMETNLGAQAIHQYCRQIAEEAGLSSADWRVELA